MFFHGCGQHFGAMFSQGDRRAMALKEQLAVDTQLHEDLGVSSIVVIEDPTLKDSVPWKVLLQTSSNSEGSETTTAEIRLSPALAALPIGQESEADRAATQIVKLVRFARQASDMHQNGIWLEISVDSALPYSNPYSCVNRLVADDDKRRILAITIGSEVTKQLTGQACVGPLTAKCFLGADIGTLSRHQYVINAKDESSIEIIPGDPEKLPYLIDSNLKSVLDVSIRSLSLFNKQARRSDTANRWDLEQICDYSIAEKYLKNKISQIESGVEEVTSYQSLEELKEGIRQVEEGLQKAIKRVRQYLGEPLAEALLFAADQSKTEAGSVVNYIRDYHDIHGYHFIDLEERLDHLFKAHALNDVIARSRGAPDTGHLTGDDADMEQGAPKTVLFLRFRLSTTDMGSEPKAEVQVSDPCEHIGYHEDNERVISVCLTPQAVKLLLNATSLEDPSIASLLRQIDETMPHINVPSEHRS